MEAIKFTEVQDVNFGRCMKMENSFVELLVTLDFGPRVIYYALCGHENTLYQDPTHRALGQPIDVYEGDICRLYGGHRLWISPEVLPRCYHPDNLPVECIEIPNGLEFIAPIEKFNQIQKSMAITLRKNSGEIEIIHKVINRGLWEIELAPWAITQLAPGGVAAIPIIGSNTGLLPNRRMTFWDYSNLGDERLTLGCEYAIICQSPEVKQAFKFGLYNHSGFGVYFNKGQAFYKHFDAIDGQYPDFGCNFELYVNGNFLENESLGRLATIGHGEYVTHKETWQLLPESEMPKTEADAAKIIRKHLNENS